MPGRDLDGRLEAFLAEVGDAFQLHQPSVRLLLGLGMVQQDATAAAVAEVRHYRDALVLWAREALSAVFGLRDRPEVADELARFTLRMASGTAVARWFDADAASCQIPTGCVSGHVRGRGHRARRYATAFPRQSRRD